MLTRHSRHVVALIAIALCQVAAAESLQVMRGPVSATVSLTPDSPPLGTTATLKLEVTAPDKVEVMLPGFGESLGRLSILDFSTTEQVDERGTTTYTQSYDVLLERSGKQHIPPLLIEFVDRRPGAEQPPAGEDAFELLSEPLRFEVTAPGTATIPPNGPLGEMPPRSFVEREPATALAIAFVALAVGALVVWLWWRHRNRPPTPESALARAQRTLQTLRKEPRASAAEIEAFFVRLSALVRTYVEGRFGLHAPELTTEEFLSAARDAPTLTPQDRNFLGDFLAAADRVKFAGFTPGPDHVEDTLAAVAQFIEQTGTRQEAEASA